MCGIVGFVNRLSTGAGQEGHVMRDLLTAGTVRGHDGAGTFFSKYNKLGEATYVKHAARGAELCDTKAAWGTLYRDARYAVGHNRAATSGELDEASTHPFVFTNVIGVHNGTINAWRSIFSGTKETMDSAALYAALNEVEPNAKDVTKFLSDLRDEAYALVWYDMRTHRLNFARNTARPLHFASTNNNMFFASEAPMLRWILERSGAAIKAEASLATHTLVSIPVDMEGEAEITKYEPSRAPAYSYQGAYQGNAGGYWSNNNRFYTPYAHSRWEDEEEEDMFSHPPAKKGRGTLPIPSNNMYHYPAYIDIKEFGVLPLRDGLRPVRTDIYNELEGLLGCRIAHHSTKKEHGSLKQVLASKFGDTAEATIDYETGQIWMPMTAVKGSLVDEALFGYIDVSGHKFPVAVECPDSSILDDVYQNAIRQCTTIIESVSIAGLRLYYDGVITFALDPIDNDTEMHIYKGTAMTGGAGLTQCIKYGSKNPAYQAIIGRHNAYRWEPYWLSSKPDQKPVALVS